MINQLRAEFLKLRSTRTTLGLVLGMTALVVLVSLLTALTSPKNQLVGVENQRTLLGIGSHADQQALWHYRGLRCLTGTDDAILVLGSSHGNGRTGRSTFARHGEPQRGSTLLTSGFSEHPRATWERFTPDCRDFVGGF
jgi:hypothetical protein